MSKPIYQLVDELPKGGITVMSLKALDFVVPGQWDNLVGFDHTIRTVTGVFKHSKSYVSFHRDICWILHTPPNC
ncbi:MAG: hypothetical protein F6K30_31130 [Cyanothece sp. SIO2G6]|nr:hypothetical protein [Cyanothece sp. SIO2G6]